MYYIITATTRNGTELPKDINLINFSVFKEVFCKVPFRTFSIKYVLEGCEKYNVNGKRYDINQGQYLLANQYSEGTVEIDSKKNVKGICIDLATDLLSEVVANRLRPDASLPDLDMDKFFRTPAFLENQYNTVETSTGQLLQKLAVEISADPYMPHNFSKAFYINLAERIVEDHVPILKQLQSVATIKHETKKDLLRKVNTGKTFIDANFTHPLDIAKVAKESSLSEYHFYRLFKSVNGISPYQYILRKRLDFAANYIRSGHFSISDSAIYAGFADISSFSKAFKQFYGASPSKYFNHPQE